MRTLKQASFHARQIGCPVKFKDYDKNGNLIDAGTAFPCGCILHKKIINNAFIGYECTIDQCPTCFHIDSQNTSNCLQIKSQKED